MPVLISHILMVLSLDPDSRKGPGLPLFLVYRKLWFKLRYTQDGSRKRRNEADPFPVKLLSTKIRSCDSLQRVNPHWQSWVTSTGTDARRIKQPVRWNCCLSCWLHRPGNALNTQLPNARHPLLTADTVQVSHLGTNEDAAHTYLCAHILPKMQWNRVRNFWKFPTLKWFVCTHARCGVICVCPCTVWPPAGLSPAPGVQGRCSRVGCARSHQQGAGEAPPQGHRDTATFVLITYNWKIVRIF